MATALSITDDANGARQSGASQPYLRLALALDSRICRAQALMQRHLGRKVRIRELAAVTGLSPSRFSHLFKKVEGVSAVQYLKHLRLQAAAVLLERNYLSVKEIAAEVGLDPSRLTQEFREAYGLTPLQYRRLRWSCLEFGNAGSRDSSGF